MTEPVNGEGGRIVYSTKQVLERLEERFNKQEDRLRSVELKVAASKWIVPIVTGLLVALATAAMIGVK